MSEFIVKCKELVGISGATIPIPEYVDMNQEIVRCRDCKHLGMRNGLGLCKRWSYFSICSQPDDFCSRAERRDAE